jgi:hypothetical protein
MWSRRAHERDPREVEIEFVIGFEDVDDADPGELLLAEGSGLRDLAALEAALGTSPAAEDIESALIAYLAERDLD